MGTQTGDCHAPRFKRFVFWVHGLALSGGRGPFTVGCACLFGFGSCTQIPLWIFPVTGGLRCAVFACEESCLVSCLSGDLVIIPPNSHILSRHYLISYDCGNTRSRLHPQLCETNRQPREALSLTWASGPRVCWTGLEVTCCWSVGKCGPWCFD